MKRQKLSPFSPVSKRPHLTLVKEEENSPLLKKRRQSCLGKRFYAFGIDIFAIALLQKIGIFSYISFVNSTFSLSSPSFREALFQNIRNLNLSTMLFTYFSYFLISYYLGHGKTLGKTLMHIRVISHEGPPEELSFMESFMRAIGHTVNYLFFFMPFLINFIRSDHRGIPDFFSQTEVMTEEDFSHSLEERKRENEREKKRERENFSDQQEKDEKQLDLFSA